jgi:hypothetical protein
VIVGVEEDPDEEPAPKLELKAPFVDERMGMQPLETAPAKMMPIAVLAVLRTECII